MCGIAPRPKIPVDFTRALCYSSPRFHDHLLGWWNWQTRQLEVLVPFWDWRFESSPEHHSEAVGEHPAAFFSIPAGGTRRRGRGLPLQIIQGNIPVSSLFDRNTIASIM